MEEVANHSGVLEIDDDYVEQEFREKCQELIPYPERIIPEECEDSFLYLKENIPQEYLSSIKASSTVTE